MTDKERLTNIIHNAQNKYLNLLKFESSILADYLIANGVIVPPCKVEQQLWFVENGEVKASTVDRLVYEELSTDDIFTRIEGYGFSVFFEDVGKIVFLTREEAEKALEGYKENSQKEGKV